MLVVVLTAVALCLIPSMSAAQALTLDLGEGGSLSGRVVQLVLLLTTLSLLPGLAVMVTCFPFIVTVLAILRSGIGLPQSPPNMLIVSLALILTWYVMDPIFAASWEAGLGPLSRGEMPLDTALPAAAAPFRSFMAGRLDAATFTALASLRPDTAALAPGEAPLSLLVPSFMLSELARAFEIGFLIFLPFLVIDLVVAGVLMSMGMMMVPPAVVSLPFKLAFFVVANGWSLVSAALVRSYL